MPDMKLDPERMPVNTHPLYPVMSKLLHAMNRAAYYDSGAWVINREEALLLVENALREEMDIHLLAPYTMGMGKLPIEATASIETKRIEVTEYGCIPRIYTLEEFITAQTLDELYSQITPAEGHMRQDEVDQIRTLGVGETMLLGEPEAGLTVRRLPNSEYYG